MSGPYDDILHLPHHVSPKRKKMSMIDRGAQFSPFAALTGYEAVIQETGRLTGEKVELTEDYRARLDQKQQLLSAALDRHPEVKVTWFVPDERKAGGEYVTAVGNVKKMDLFHRRMVMMDGRMIELDQIMDLEGEIFQPLESWVQPVDRDRKGWGER